MQRWWTDGLAVDADLGSWPHGSLSVRPSLETIEEGDRVLVRHTYALGNVRVVELLARKGNWWSYHPANEANLDQAFQVSGQFEEVRRLRGRKAVEVWRGLEA